MALVEIARFASPIEADIAHGRLAAEGVAGILFDAGMSWAGSAIPVRLMVDERDRARAEALLSRDRDEWA